LTRPDQLRIAAALGASLLAHAVLLHFLRLPPDQPPPAAGSRLNLLLIPIPGERRAESVQSASTSPAATNAREAARLGPRPRKAETAAAPPEPARRRQPSVTAGPISAPPDAPASLLADASAYVAPLRLTVHPDFAAPFRMNYPREALAEGRKGVVVVQVMIDETGRVVEALAAPGAPEDFAAAAVAGLRAARFLPGRAGGGPVKARAYYAVSFVIE
jgi:TonB family protein